MIGFVIILLSVLSALTPSGLAQDYEERPSRASYRGFDDDDVELVAKPAPTVVPILKQIDRHNDDGSYTYGFESADGSFKIETKQANGEVKGKYGYVDAHGKLHVVEYGANKYGFQPSGEGITVPPVNFNAPPEEFEEELPRRVQAKQQTQIRRPLPQVQQLQPWEQPRPVALPAPKAAAPQPRPTPATPHIIYNNNAPVPKKPQFFAGAQPVGEPLSDFSYQEPIAPKKAAPQQPRPQAPRTHTIAYTEPSQAAEPNFFIPSSQFRQQTQFSDPQIPVQRPKAVVRYEEPEEDVQYFRPQPAKAQVSQYFEPQQQQQPARPYVAPRVAAKASSKGGFLDQLEQQFALPQGNGQPTHNIAFGFY